MPFFSDFSPKNHCSRAHILSKKVHSLKIKLLSCPYFVRKTSILSKTQCSHVIFFKFFMRNPMLSCPYLVKSTSILSKIHYIICQKSQYALFFRFFSKKKNSTHAHILSKKRPFSKKQTGLMPIFCQKNVLSLKNTKLSCNFFFS